jgi:ribonucleotide reductase beta subunit family protein with ferritin-like domain
MKSIFNRRVNILPYEYPSLLQYKDAIRHAYWIDTEYNFTTDIQDFKVNVSDAERDVIKKTMLAISQIEVNVKTFWADMYKRMPITEIGDVGMTFAECHIEGTEVLTPRGWVDFRDIKVGDDVIQFNKESKTLSITKVNHVVADEYEGTMFSLLDEDEQTVAVVTPNHRFLFVEPDTSNLVEGFASDINSKCSDNFDVYTLPHKVITKEEFYKGKVYCINVDSGYIVTAYRKNSLISGNSEVRHKDAYARLLRILGLEDEFKTVVEIPAIKDRIAYLSKYLDGTRSKDDKMYTKSVLLFSLFIEHVSLFSQFLIMMSFNKERNIFKGISNVVEATSKEEDIHGNFGAEIINIIKGEHPEWFDAEFEELIYSACKKAYKAECKILDWIFEQGELDFLSKITIQHFIMNRFNNSLKKIGMLPIFEVDINEIEKTKWFELETIASKESDFFYKRIVDYSKKQKSITEDDLF